MVQGFNGSMDLNIFSNFHGDFMIFDIALICMFFSERFQHITIEIDEIKMTFLSQHFLQGDNFVCWNICHWRDWKLYSLLCNHKEFIDAYCYKLLFVQSCRIRLAVSHNG